MKWAMWCMQVFEIKVCERLHLRPILPIKWIPSLKSFISANNESARERKWFDGGLMCKFAKSRNILGKNKKWRKCLRWDFSKLKLAHVVSEYFKFASGKNPCWSHGDFDILSLWSMKLTSKRFVFWLGKAKLLVKLNNQPLKPVFFFFFFEISFRLKKETKFWSNHKRLKSMKELVEH